MIPKSGSQPLGLTPDFIQLLKQQKLNPLPSLTPHRLASLLEDFELGRLRETVILWERIAERDDVIAGLKPKREKDVSRLGMRVVPIPGSGSDGERHREILERFWKSIRCVNVWDRNERGGFRRLVKQMMSAVSYRYSAHHIVWRPQPDGGLHAEFEFVPLWMFENRIGSLRFLRLAAHGDGEELAEGEWMVTTGDGLMIACSIGYLAKRSAFNDWLVFSEKFSVPGVLGRTSASKESPEGQAMRAAVESFGHDWTAVIYGDDGTHEKPLEILQSNGSPMDMPMPAVVERVDRKFAAIYRGADLSSMSSQGNVGTGASVQGKETKILRRDDAETITETLADVSRQVVEWHFGPGIDPLARVELVIPDAESDRRFVGKAGHAVKLGARISAEAFAKRAGLPLAKNDQDVL